VERALDMIMGHGRKKIGILGLAFKAGTDDLRHSPMVDVTERLIGKGYDVRLYDRNVSLSQLIGANREYILSHIPHIARLLVETLDEIASFADVVVVGNTGDEFAGFLSRLRPEQRVIDLVRLKGLGTVPAAYDGIAW
jgi:GDP-mannose 6-dehydrogenase